MGNFTSIRKATSSDLDLLCTLCPRVFSENFAHHFNPGGLESYLNEVYGCDRIKADLASDDINYFIAYHHSMPVGFMKLNLNSNLPGFPLSHGLEVEKIYFFPDYQGKGIGRMMMTSSIGLACTLNKELIWLGVIDTNISAIEFYKKIGFEVHDRTRLEIPYFKDELKGMWRMKLMLPKN